MKISELLKDTQIKGNYVDCDILDVTDNSNDVKKGSLFVCIKGEHFDGHKMAKEAAQKGAFAIVSEYDTGVKNQFIVDDTRKFYATICSNFYNNPEKKLKLIGITGTNGKTTTSFLLKQILEHFDKKVGLIGTVKNIIGDNEYDTSLTTPDRKDLEKLFSEMVDNSYEYCIMEVSSQALAQRRVEGCHFDFAIFTNLTIDHLDYHKTMENYRDAKKELFKISDTAIINIDDDSAEYMTKDLDCKSISYSVNSDDADFSAKNVKCFSDGIRYELLSDGNISRVNVKIPGSFNVYNSMAAAATAITMGFSIDEVIKALENAKPVKGRLEVLPTDTNYKVIIDYAHTPDGLQNVLTSIREFTNGKIITVFGCGGDRDKSKRPLMGKIVSELSDVAVVTSDNFRTENKMAIIDDILAGIKKGKAKIKVLEDRTAAIEYALEIAKDEDTVLLAGKGHETYQISNNGKEHYDEREVVENALKGLN
ncbi:MAG: UDP-N-acetylmuramoyl-L-alanyl-D-glutamate--2,6-diaminopimelate ligase [Oscillospiraceae bacterium]